MAHSTRFNRDWLSKADYKPWLASVEDVTKAYCKMCMKTFSLSNMGEIAVKSHASGKKHQTAVTQSQKASSVSEFFEAKSRTTSGLVSSENLEEPSASLIHDHEVTLQESGSMSTSHGNVMSKFILTKHQHKAEILWALKTVMSHFSYNSSTNIADVFRAMFPDSAIAQKMNCGPTKLSYLICFGIAPYFKQQLLKELKEAQCYVISFDESLNTELHEEQMDFLVRYFHKDKATCRYITSGFFGHTRAEDLKMKFEEGIIELEKKKMLQISMDGPNVNWKLYDSIVEKRSENDDYPGLIDIGSCNLHIVHGAFRTGVQKTKWGIDGILQALYNLFPYSPAKREDYQKLTGSKVFPLPFSGTRWIEDKKVAARAIQIWLNITFFFEVLDQKIAYKGLWCTVQLLLTLSHGQAAVEQGFSVNKDILAPNLKTLSLTSIRLIHDTISTKEINIADYIITDELCKSCSHASNRYKMYMMERQTKDQEPEKVRKRKALQDDLVSAKKRKTELQVTAEKLVHSAELSGVMN